MYYAEILCGLFTFQLKTGEKKKKYFEGCSQINCKYTHFLATDFLWTANIFPA